MADPQMFDNPIQTGALGDPLVRSPKDDFCDTGTELNDQEALSKNDGRIVQAVLDLYSNK